MQTTIATTTANYQATALDYGDSAALAEFKAKGWTYRTAAKRLGVHFGHIHMVLSGERHSRSLLAKIAALPPRPKAS